MYQTFAGFHQQEEPQWIEVGGVGRIDISVKNVTKTNDDDSSSESEVKYDSECISIKDALPRIEISRKTYAFEFLTPILQLIPSRFALF